MTKVWHYCKWGDIATLEYGKSLRDYSDSAGEYPVYGTNGQIGWCSQPLCPFPSVIIGRKGAYRGVHYSKTPFFVIDTAFYLKPRINIDLRWAYYELLTQDINGLDSGSAIPSTSRQDFYSLPVSLPPLEQQKIIATFLGVLDDKIEHNRKINHKLEDIAKAIFKSWFVDFDPVVAKSQGQTPVGMSEEIACLFPSSISETEKGPIPKTWRIGCIGELISLNRETINPVKYPEMLFSHFSIPSYDDGQMPRTELGKFIRSNKYIVPLNSLLISKLNPNTPRLWWPTIVDNVNPICSTEFLVCLPKPQIPLEYIYSQLNSDGFITLYANFVTGTSGSHQRVKPEDFLHLQIIIPSTECINYYANSLSPLFTKVRQNISENQKLKSIRNALLPIFLSSESSTEFLEKFMEKTL